MGRARRRARGLAVLLSALALMSIGSGSLAVTAAGPAGDAGDSGPSAIPPPDSVVFGAVGDFDNKAPDYPDMVAEAKRLGNRGGMFLLALGDLGYVADEQQWCTVLKSAFNATLVVAGNHDTTQSGPGDIDTDVVYCPFNVDATLMAGPTYGYGKSYFFDYPRSGPLVRVLMITAGTAGTQLAGENYGSGGAEFDWVVAAVNGARTAGIPWVVVGMHKLCIDAGAYGCEIGHALFDKLVDLRVDLILHGHYHSYQRSKQLALSANCTTIPSDGAFDADCIVASGDRFTKGAGTIDLIDGAGGRDTYLIPLNGSDPELGYFDAAMGSEGNTQGKSNGHGPIVVTLNATTLTGTTTLCPLGTGDLITGECPSQAPDTFQDTFTISSSEIPPPPLSADFRSDPANPVAGQEVVFNASASGGTPPYSFVWDFGDGSSGLGMNVRHSYERADNYTVNLTVTDAGTRTATAQRRVAVGEPPSLGGPVTSLHLSGTEGLNGWYVSPVTVNLTATSPSSPVVAIAYRLDGGAWSPYDRPFPIGEGLHTLEYRATDGLGNTEGVRTVSLKLDASPPRLALPASGGIQTTSPFEFSWSEADDISGLLEHRVTVDGVPIAVTDSRTTIALSLSDGGHTIGLRAIDHAGNEAWGNVTLYVDTNVFSPTGPLQGMPSYVLIAIAGGAAVFFVLHRRSRAKRNRPR